MEAIEEWQGGTEKNEGIVYAFRDGRTSRKKKINIVLVLYTIVKKQFVVFLHHIQNRGWQIKTRMTNKHCLNWGQTMT